MESKEIEIGLGVAAVAALLWYLDSQGVFNHAAVANLPAAILPQTSIAPTGVSTTIAPAPVPVPIVIPAPVVIPVVATVAYKDMQGPVAGTTNQDWIGSAGSVMYPAKQPVGNTKISPNQWNAFRQQSGASGIVSGAGLNFPYVQNGVMFLGDFHAALRLEGKE